MDAWLITLSVETQPLSPFFCMTVFQHCWQAKKL